MPFVALTRPVPGSLGACELTHLERVPIDVARARAQHAAYERRLESAGCHVHRLPALDDAPDSVFVEDTAVVLDELAIITRPGAPSRQGETRAVAEVLSGYRRLERMSAPATLDGGDVLRLGRTLYVGVGGRTNGAGVAQLGGFVRPWGYDVRGVPAGACLHLKSAATEPAPGLVLLNPAWVRRPDIYRLAHDRRRSGGAVRRQRAPPRRDRPVCRGRRAHQRPSRGCRAGGAGGGRVRAGEGGGGHDVLQPDRRGCVEFQEIPCPRMSSPTSP